jgi:hypothetical protein
MRDKLATPFVMLVFNPNRGVGSENVTIAEKKR